MRDWRIRGRLSLADEGTARAVTALVRLLAVSMIVQTGADPVALLARMGRQISDSATLGTIVDDVLRTHPKQVATYRAGKTRLLSFFVGQVMKRTGGRANPEIVNRMLTAALGGQCDEP